MSNNFGFSIFRFIENPDFKLARLPDDKIDGRPCYFIKLTDAKKSDTIFGADKKTFLIPNAAFQTPMGLQQRYYDDFKWAKGVKFIQPRSLRIYNNSSKTTEFLGLMKSKNSWGSFCNCSGNSISKICN